METKENKPKFFTEVFITWIKIVISVGWLALIFMGFKIYNGITTNPDFSILDGILVFILGTLGALIILYLFALIITPLIGIDRKRILKDEANKDVKHLFGFIHTGSTTELWQLACDAVVRIGPSTVPMLLLALNKETCPVINPAGFKQASNINIRAGAAYCLGKLKESSAINPLLAALDDSESVVRVFVCRALGEIGDKISLNKLTELAQNDKDESVRNQAKLTIEGINQSSK